MAGSEPQLTEPALFELDVTQRELPVLHRAPLPVGGDAYAPITFKFRGITGLVEFHTGQQNEDGFEVAGCHDPGTVRIFLSEYGAQTDISYIGDLELACADGIDPDDLTIQNLIIEAAARYERRLRAGLRLEDEDTEDGHLTFCGEDDWADPAERATALNTTDFGAYAAAVNTIVAGVEAGTLRPDHAASVIARYAIDVFHRHR